MTKSTTSTVVLAAGALLIGGVATAAYMNHRGQSASYVATKDSGTRQGLEYAQIMNVSPVAEKVTSYGTVTSVDPVKESISTHKPEQICHDVVVHERLPERDGNIGGTVAGALIGGLVGNQFGHGNGRKATTAAGAVAGGFVGNEIDREHVGGRVVAKTVKRCHSEDVTSESTVTKGYTVNFRRDDGTTGSQHMDDKPGDKIDLGQVDHVVGYDVTYQYDGQQKQVRLPERPSADRLPVVDGQIVTQTLSTNKDASSHQ